eukprot:1869131-Alexandrium_andersonii.AAC.1
MVCRPRLLAWAGTKVTGAPRRRSGGRSTRPAVPRARSTWPHQASHAASGWVSARCSSVCG